MEENLIIIKNGIQYVLPSGWAIVDSGSYEFNNKLEDKAFVHGGNVVGDGKVKGRTITVEFDMKEVTEQEHDDVVNLAYSAFYGKYNLIVGREDRMYKIAAISKIKHKFEKGFKQRWSNVTVSLLLAEPFRYSINPITIRHEFSEAQTEKEITFFKQSSVDTPLIFKFTPALESDLPAVKIQHVESGQEFTMTDTVLVNKTAVIDGEQGTVRRGEDNSINTFSGLFLHALPGSNTLKYTGKACTLEIVYTPRWFV